MFSLDSKASLEEVINENGTKSEKNTKEGNKETTKSAISDACDDQLQLNDSTRKHKICNDVTTRKSKKEYEKSKQDAKISAAIFNHQQTGEACLTCIQLSTELKTKEEELQKEKARAKAELRSKEEEIQKAKERENKYKEKLMI